MTIESKRKPKTFFERQREREVKAMRDRRNESYLEEIMLEKAEKEKNK